jgi:hypothetical protein
VGKANLLSPLLTFIGDMMDQDMLYKVRDSLLSQGPVSREDIRKMVAGLDSSVMEKYFGKSKAQPVSEQEMEAIFKFLGV